METSRVTLVLTLSAFAIITVRVVAYRHAMGGTAPNTQAYSLKETAGGIIVFGVYLV